MPKYFSLTILIGLVTGCVFNTELEAPFSEPAPVLNGILHPDSTVSVRLTLSRPLASTTPFEAIINGRVLLYEQKELIDTLKHRGDGIYESDKKPTPGFTYKVTADIPGFATLQAEDTVPLKPWFAGCFKQSTFGELALYDVTVDIEIQTSTPYVNWIEFISNDYYKEPGKQIDTTRLISEKLFYIYSDSPYVDNFNGLFDNNIGLMQYVLYMRISPGFQNPRILVRGAAGQQSSPFFRYTTISNPFKDQSLVLNLYACSEAYDRYLKATMIDFVTTELEGVPIPFTGATKIYSNVVNGTGIFAAVNYSQIRVEQNPCP